jgi:citrate lyase beta subunit
MEARRKSWLCQSALKKGLPARAQAAGADVVHFDLEDSVAERLKGDARQALLHGLDECGPDVVAAVRVNALSSHTGLEDLLAIRSARRHPDILIVPKARIVTDLTIIGDLWTNDCQPDVYAVIESPASLHELGTLERTPRLLKGLIVGTADYAAEMGVPLESANFDHLLASVAQSAHRLHLQAVDSPCFDLVDPAAVESEIRHTRSLGFTGKIALNPAQVPVINTSFSWSPDEVSNAREILSLQAESSTTPVGSRRGRLIGPPFKKLAGMIAEQAREEARHG